MIPRKILVIKLRSLGDTLLMTAPLNELRRSYPEAEIHVAVSQAWAPLLEHHPAVNRIWTYLRRPEPGSRAKAVARLAFQLRKEKYDLAINLHSSPSSSAIAYATGAPVRSIHFHGLQDKNRYSTVVIPGKGQVKPIIERDMDTIRALGIHVPAGRMPDVVLTPSEMIRADEQLNSMGLKSPVLVLGLGATRPSKMWPMDRFAALALSWVQDTQGSVLGIGSADEKELEQDFLRHLDALSSDPATRTEMRAKIQTQFGLPLRRVAALLSRCQVMAGNDSGPRHLAVAVRLPTVTLFGPEDPFEWHPYPPNMHPYFFMADLPCRKDADAGQRAWCAVDTCVDEDLKCLRSIGIDAVLAQCKRLAQEYRLK